MTTTTEQTTPVATQCFQQVHESAEKKTNELGYDPKDFSPATMDKLDWSEEEACITNALLRTIPPLGRISLGTSLETNGIYLPLGFQAVA